MERARKNIVAALLEADAVATAAAASAKAKRAEGTLAEEGLGECVRAYVQAKFRLPEAVRGNSSLEALAEESLARALRIDPDLARKESAASTCDGASTTDMKQALLFLALQRDFDVQLSGIALAYAETMGDLCALVWEAMRP